MSEPTVYIKGYKVDREKTKATYGSSEDDPENILKIFNPLGEVSPPFQVSWERMGAGWECCPGLGPRRRIR